MPTALLQQRKTQPWILHLAFACLCLVLLVATHNALLDWLRLSRTSTESSDLWLIPFVSAFLLVSEGQQIFRRDSIGFYLPGVVLVIFGGWLGIEQGLTVTESSRTSSLPIFGVLIAIYGAFLTCYGTKAFARARFPLLFSIFAVPIPASALDQIVGWLQYGSAAVVHAIFWILRVPFVQHGTIFSLPGLSFEIAAECSGIRSSFALLVLTLLLAYFTLSSTWRRLILVSAVVPLVLIKNGIRIVTITLLSIMVDPSFLTGRLHHDGGFVFFGLVLAMESLLCWFLQRSEHRQLVGSKPPSRKGKCPTAVSTTFTQG